MAVVSGELEPRGRHNRGRRAKAALQMHGETFVASSKKGLRGRRETMGNEATVAELGE